MFCAVPMFTTGMSRNLVQILPNSGSKRHTSMMHDLSILSLDSSSMMDKFYADNKVKEPSCCFLYAHNQKIWLFHSLETWF